MTSGSSSQDNNNKMEEKESEEDLWLLWGKIINEWDTWSKKRAPQTKVKTAHNLSSYILFLPTWASKISQWWFGFRLEPIFNTAPAAFKNAARLKVVKLDPKLIISFH